MARSDWKNKFAIFLPKRKSLLERRPGWTDKFLNFFWVAWKSLSLVAVACFLPGRVKDLSAHREDRSVTPLSDYEFGASRFSESRSLFNDVNNILRVFYTFYPMRKIFVRRVIHRIACCNFEFLKNWRNVSRISIRGVEEFPSLLSTFISDLYENWIRDKTCPLLGYYYAASSGNSLPTFRDNLSVPLQGSDRMSRNVDKGLPLLTA